MGPRETAYRALPCETCAPDPCGCGRIRVPMLADALEEALAEWDSLREAFLAGDYTTDDQVNISAADLEKIERLRGLLR
jgi:hypothetical protein